jgi:hypothetical protein
VACLVGKWTNLFWNAQIDVLEMHNTTDIILQLLRAHRGFSFVVLHAAVRQNYLFVLYLLLTFLYFFSFVSLPSLLTL